MRNFENTNVTVDEVIEIIKTKVVPTVKSGISKVFEKSKTLVQNYQSKVEMDQQQESLNKHKIKRVLIKLVLVAIITIGINIPINEIIFAPIFLGVIWVMLATMNILKTRVFTCLSGLLNKATKVFLMANIFGLVLISSLEMIDTYVPALVLGTIIAIIFDYILPTKVRNLWSKL